MRKILIPVLLLLCLSVRAQLNNSWIDYSKTYHRFYVGKSGLYRINASILGNIGLLGTPAEHFQLWRNGEQVRVYTSVATGNLGPAGYIEFWGRMNDGVPDRNLYLKPGFQLCDSFSLFSDTAAYYLTVNTNPAANLRYTNGINNIAGNTLSPDAYFMRSIAAPYKQRINGGYAVKVGEFVYSSSYEMGEGWTSNDAAPGLDLFKEFTGMNVYTAAPPNSVSFYISAFGNALNTRSLRVKFFNNVVLDTRMDFFDTVKKRIDNLPLTLLQSPDYLQVSMNGTSTVPTDRVVVANLEITYPAKFNFNNEKNFQFSLAPSPVGNYLIIDNFNAAGVPPVLYSISDGMRYVGDIAVAGKVRFALPPAGGTAARQFLLVSQEASNINNVSSPVARNFIDFSLPANQGDYLIISNSKLFNDGSGNNYVEQYRQYRNSPAGGSFNSKVITIDELTDQFGLGIRNHPASIRDFIRFADNRFVVKPKFVFLIGRGVSAYEYRTYENEPAMDKLDLVPTFGWPASDVLLSCPPGTFVPLTPIGRLAAINGGEIKNYLDKVKEYEQAQADPVQTFTNKAWMKNIIHVIGGSDSIENAQFTAYMAAYENVMKDSLFGGKVETFVKASTSAVEQANGARIEELINEGVSEIAYFGHSSANTLAFNLSNPEVYSNRGKYPFFNVSGCSAGNFFTFDPTRLNNSLSISEKYVLAEQRGSIGFMASTHLGIPPFLNFYNTELYRNTGRVLYGNAIGNIIRRGLETLGSNPATLNYYQRIHLEEINLHGDPAIKINSFGAADYSVEDQHVKIAPSIITVADNSFNLNVVTYNIGKAVNDSIRIVITRKLANDSVQVLYNSMRKATLYSDSFNLVVPINPITDKGQNRITITVDADNRVPELSEANNSVTREFFIFEDEIRPVSPYNYAIVNQQNIPFTASTANPLMGQRQYVMEIDTTETFSSAFKKQYTASGSGGLVQFNPTNISFTDSTVYYWRTSIVPLNGTQPIWNSFSFVYLPGSSAGYNQSHFYQHRKSTFSNTLRLDDDRVFRFSDINRTLYIRTGLFPATDYDRIDVVLDFDQLELYGCRYSSLQFMVYDTLTMKPWKNFNVPGGTGRFGSWPICSGTSRNSFEFPYADPVYRKRAMDFLDSIPDGMYVSITNLGNASTNNSFIADWQADQAVLGAGNSLYHKLKALGFTQIDSFTRNLPFIYFSRKNNTGYPRYQVMGAAATDQLNSSFQVRLKDNSGNLVSPQFGPAKRWNELHWRARSLDPQLTDKTRIDVIGVRSNGTQTQLRTITGATDTTLNFVDPAEYPYLRLRMNNEDIINVTPAQLEYWRINAELVPEGAIAPNLLFSLRDSVDQGEPADIALAFKNVSPVAFDSIRANMLVTDRSNRRTLIELPRLKPLQPNDTAVIRYRFDTRNYPGVNTISLTFNPENDQPEQYLYNNFLFKDLYVKEDKVNPLLDITFDGVHILNKDIVASRPSILIRLKDESRFMALADTSLLKVTVRFPDGNLYNYHFNQDMRFTPANLGSGQNNATIEFTPYFPEDGEYELIVSGKDAVGNKAGNLEYRVIFSVINAPMISNMLNYPNPFTTSTAFVFTITGREVPQNIRIQILTVTGKVVREITRAELGDLHVGRNITDFKWDGTDMYGQPLGNGVYLYRVITNNNGRSLDKYRAEGDRTDKYFKAGYGKMYLMR